MTKEILVAATIFLATVFWCISQFSSVNTQHTRCQELLEHSIVVCALHIRGTCSRALMVFFSTLSCFCAPEVRGQWQRDREPSNWATCHRSASMIHHSPLPPNGPSPAPSTVLTWITRWHHGLLLFSPMTWFSNNKRQRAVFEVI